MANLKKERLQKPNTQYSKRAMDWQQNELDRLLFFDKVRKTAEAEYTKNPHDADNLTRWGIALYELAEFESFPESKKMNKEAVSKLEEALVVNPKKHFTLWCMGNAHAYHGFSIQNWEEAKVYFDKGVEYFQLALDADPENQGYRGSLEVAVKASQLQRHVESHKFDEAKGEAVPTTAIYETVRPSASSSRKKTQKLKKSSDKRSSDLKNIHKFGWIILVFGILISRTLIHYI